ATLEMDSLGAVAIKDQLGADLTAGAVVANSYAEFIYNGTNWVFLQTLTAPTAAPGDADTSIANTAFVMAAIAAINIRVFRATEFYPISASTCKVLVYLKGGGGGGGGTPEPGLVGGGGGEGEEAWLLTTAVALSGQTMTVAAGGGQGLDGLSGGTSSAGALCTANGGQGGTRAVFGGQGGIGGNSGAGGSFRMPGAYGHTGCTTSGSGVGIYAPGGGKGAGGVGGPGIPNSGGGGGGGMSNLSPGNGGSGIIVCF